MTNKKNNRESKFDDVFDDILVCFEGELMLSRKKYCKKEALNRFRAMRPGLGLKEVTESWVKYRFHWEEGERDSAWWECEKNIKGAQPIWLVA